MKKIDIAVFDVGLGSCCLVELPPTKKQRRFGIVDCFRGPSDSPFELLDTLRSVREQSRLSIEFLVLTHYHRDHLLGTAALLREFGTTVRRFCDPGLDARAIALALHPTGTVADSEMRADLEAIREFKSKHPERLLPLVAPGQTVFSDSASHLDIVTAAPPGDMLHRVERRLATAARQAMEAALSGNPPIAANRVVDLNRTSSALELRYQGRRVLFGGDVYASAWRKVLKDAHLPVDVFVLSHHGASNGFPKPQWARELGKVSTATVVSASGPHHPSASVLDFLSKQGHRVFSTHPDAVSDSVRRAPSLLDHVAGFHFGEEAKARPGRTVRISVGQQVRLSGPEL